MKPRGHAYFLITLLALSLLLVIISLTSKFFSTKFLPLIFGGINSILIAVELVKELGSEKGSADDKAKRTERASWRGYLLAAIWFGGFLLAVYLLGFIISTALFVFFFMKTHGARWFAALTYSVLTTVAVWAVFQYVMKTNLYPGLVIRLLS
jgi:hypothetical protein